MDRDDDIITSVYVTPQISPTRIKEQDPEAEPSGDAAMYKASAIEEPITLGLSTIYSMLYCSHGRRGEATFSFIPRVDMRWSARNCAGVEKDREHSTSRGDKRVDGRKAQIVFGSSMMISAMCMATPSAYLRQDGNRHFVCSSSATRSRCIYIKRWESYHCTLLSYSSHSSHLLGSRVTPSAILWRERARNKLSSCFESFVQTMRVCRLWVVGRFSQ